MKVICSNSIAVFKSRDKFFEKEKDGQPTFGTPVAPGDMLLHEISEGRTVVLKTEEYESLVTQLDIARKILKIHRGEKIE